MSPSLTINNTLGALVLGGYAAAIFCGMNLLQTYTYYQHSTASSGRLHVKFIVGALWVLDAAHMGLSIDTVYHYSVANFSNATALFRPTNSLTLTVALTVISNTIVRIVYTTRVWKISGKNNILCAIIAILGTVYLAFGIHLTAVCVNVNAWSDVYKYEWEAYIIYGSSLLLDAIIALSLCFFLTRSRTGIKRADSLITILMFYCVNTGLVTTLLNIVVLAVYGSMKNLVYVGIYMSSSKLYLCCLLATLNGGQRLQDHRPDVISLGQLQESVGTRSKSGRGGQLAALDSSSKLKTDQESGKSHTDHILINVENQIDTRDM